MRTKEVASDVGLTERQLQWWDESRLLPVEQVHGNREYSEGDVRLLRVLAEMRRRGISLQKIREVLPKIRKRLRGKSWAYIIVRGEHVALAPNAESALDVLDQMQLKYRGDTCVLRLQPRP